MKKYTFILSLICFLFPYLSTAQDTTQVGVDSVNLTGVVKSKPMYMVFENVIYNGVPVKGELKPNLAVSKYHVNIAGNGKTMSGVIYTKELKNVLEISFQDKTISGGIKNPLAGGAYKWDVHFLDAQITGNVQYNLAQTKATFELTSSAYEVTGQVKDRVTAISYNLKINGKSVKGTIKKQTPSKQQFNLVLDHLNEDEFALFFLIESMRMIKVNMEDIEDFQNH